MATRPKLVGLWLLLWVLVACGLPTTSLKQRLKDFPQISSAPGFSLETADILYPEWFMGTWRVASTSQAVEAPLGVEFINAASFARAQRERGKTLIYYARFVRNDQGEVVADRAFNTIAITEALLGKKSVLNVTAANPNHLTIDMIGNRRGELDITRRHSEIPCSNCFASSEFYRQVLVSLGDIPTTKDIEATNLYQRQDAQHVTGDQMTAVFLTPTDELFFQAGGKAVTVYRYRLQFTAVTALPQNKG